MNETEKNSVENIDLQKEESPEQLRKAALYWKEKHDKVLATAVDALMHPKESIKFEDIKPEWKKNL